MKLLVLLTLLFCSSTAALAQISIKEAICRMPEEILPYITNDQKSQIQKLKESNDSMKVKNTFNGTTTINIKNNDFAEIKMSKATDMQIKLLSTGDSAQVICTIKTINSPLKESSVKFYSTNWIQLDSSFGLPDTNKPDAALNMFIHKPDSMTEERFNTLCKYIEPIILNTKWNSKNETISFKLSLPFVQKDVLDEINSIIKEISFKWEGKYFKKY